MCQNLPPDGKLDEAGTRKQEDGRSCKPIAPQILSESSIGTRHQSQNSRQFAEILSTVNFGDHVVVCQEQTAAKDRNCYE